MRAEQLGVEGAFVFTPEIFPDERGRFLSPYQEPAFVEAVGHRLFPVVQTSYSVSRRGAVRGIHYTATPPGMAKFAYCPRGRVIDIAVDVRVGSPTFGRWDSVLLDEHDGRAVYLPVGMGHVFIVLEEDTVVTYALSEGYVRENEFALSPLDPELGLPIPEDLTPVLSERDREAPTLAAALAAGLLPEYDKCVAAQAAFHDRH